MDAIKLPKQIGHFDFNPHNLIYNPKNYRIIALLDFDLIRVSQRARDIALGMHKISRVFGNKTERKNDVGGSIPNRTQIFLNGYNKIVKLTKKEESAIPDLIIDEGIRKIIYLLKKSYLDNDSIIKYEINKQITLINEALTLK